jgi:hypothetical protein
MTDKSTQHDPIFTKKGAILGLVAYVVVALIIVWVFV